MSNVPNPFEPRALEALLHRAVGADLARNIEHIVSYKYPSLKNVQWAWAFLRRKREYLDAYDVYISAPQYLRQEHLPKNLFDLPGDAEVRWLHLEPAIDDAQTLAAWRIGLERLTPGRRAIGLHKDLVPPLGLSHWIKPDTLEADLPPFEGGLFTRPDLEFIPRIRQDLPRLRDSNQIVLARASKFEGEFYDDGEAAIVFNVSLELDQQIAEATATLNAYHDRLIKWRLAEALPIKGDTTVHRFGPMLTALDLRAEDLTYQQIADLMSKLSRDTASWNFASVKVRLREARQMINIGYRALPFLKDVPTKKSGNG